MTLHIKRVEHLVLAYQKIKHLQYRIFDNNTKFETDQLIKYVIHKIRTEADTELNSIQQQNFAELINECKLEGIKFLLISNWNTRCIAPSELVTNKTRDTRGKVAIWKIADKFLKMGCGNGDQAQITNYGTFCDSGFSCLNFVYGKDRCGLVYDIEAGATISGTAQINQVLAWKLR